MRKREKICWICALIKWLEMESHLNNKKVEAIKRHMRGNIAGMVKCGEYVPRHLPMRLTKQNHTTVSIASTKFNKSKNN